MIDELYDVLKEDEANGQWEKARRHYLKALGETMTQPAGATFIAAILDRAGLMRPVLNATDMALHNFALALFADMREADGARSMIIMATIMGSNAPLAGEEL